MGEIAVIDQIVSAGSRCFFHLHAVNISICSGKSPNLRFGGNGGRRCVGVAHLVPCPAGAAVGGRSTNPFSRCAVFQANLRFAGYTLNISGEGISCAGFYGEIGRQQVGRFCGLQTQRFTAQIRLGGNLRHASAIGPSGPHIG